MADPNALPNLSELEQRQALRVILQSKALTLRTEINFLKTTLESKLDELGQVERQLTALLAPTTPEADVAESTGGRLGEGS